MALHNPTPHNTQVHVGAACPDSKLACLLSLLGPGPGRLLVPVDSELRLVEKAADGSISQRIVSQVSRAPCHGPAALRIRRAVLLLSCVLGRARQQCTCT